QPHFTDAPGCFLQQALGNGLIPRPDVNMMIMQETGETPGPAMPLGWSQHLIGDLAQVNGTTPQDTAHQPGQIAYSCDPFHWKRLSNVLNQGIIGLGDGHFVSCLVVVDA